MYRSIRAAALVATALTPTFLHAADIPSEVTGTASDGEGPGDPIVVTGKREGYSVDAIVTATKTDTPLIDTPQSVSVVTAEQISDQAMTSIGDVMAYVPGVAMESGEGHRDAVVIRGNISTADFFTDGLRDDVQHYRGLYNVEQVEVLKGPNALIFGRGGAGGIVNRVLKRPFHEQYLSGAVSIDQYGAGAASLDMNSPLTLTSEGRLNAVYERMDNFRDIEGERWAVNPTVSWHPGAATTIDLGYEYAKDERDVDRGLPSDNGQALEGYDETFFGIRGVNRSDFDKHVVDAKLTQEISERVTFTSKALFGDYDKIYTNAVPSSAVTDVDGVPSVRVSAYQDWTYRQNWLWQNDLVAKASTGSADHTILVGIDYARQDTEAGRLRGFFDTLPADQKSANGRETWVALSDPFVIPEVTFRGGSGERQAQTEVDAVGVYFQDQIDFGPYVEAIVGIRHDWIDIRVEDLVGGTDVSRSDSLWSPRLGLVLKSGEGLNFYGSWSRSFLPQSGDQFNSLSPSDAALAPERFDNLEVGMKWEIAPSLDMTLAAYQLERTNTRAIDPSTFETVLTGEQRTKGIELGINGKVGKLSLSGGLSMLEAEITKTTTAAQAGTPVPHVPKFQASLWGRYDLTDRLGVGAGIAHRSSVFASYTNAVKVDPLTQVDAAMYYDLSDKVALQVNVDNLFDASGIEFAHSDNNLHPVDDRTVRGSLRFAF